MSNPIEFILQIYGCHSRVESILRVVITFHTLLSITLTVKSGEFQTIHLSFTPLIFLLTSSITLNFLFQFNMLQLPYFSMDIFFILIHCLHKTIWLFLFESHLSAFFYETSGIVLLIETNSVLFTQVTGTKTLCFPEVSLRNTIPAVSQWLVLLIFEDILSTICSLLIFPHCPR